MKKILSLSILVLLLSCTNSIYHVASLQSEQVKVVENDFIVDNEHLRVVYNFWEAGGRMRFLVYNKTDQPLYIDWSKSFMVRNDIKTSYTQIPPLPKRASADTVHYVYQNAIMEPYRVTARTGRVAEIPSQTYVAIADFPIRQMVLHPEVKRTVFTYTKANSPLRIGQQVAYSFDKNLADPHLITHSFWVDTIKLLKANELTRLYGSLGRGRPNALYVVEKRNAPAQTLVAVGVVVGGAVGITIIMLKDMPILGGFNLCC